MQLPGEVDIEADGFHIQECLFPGYTYLLYLFLLLLLVVDIMALHMAEVIMVMATTVGGIIGMDMVVDIAGN